MFRKPFSGSRQAEDASYYGAGLAPGSPDPFDQETSHPSGVEMPGETDPDGSKPLPQSQARMAPLSDPGEDIAPAGGDSESLPAAGGDPAAPVVQGSVGAPGEALSPETAGPAAPLQPIGAALMPASVGGPSDSPPEPADVPPVGSGGPIGAPAVGGAVAGPSHFADDLGWSDALWGDGGGFEAILRGVLDGGLPFGVDGPAPLNVFVENLDIDLINVIQNTLVQNTTILFDASEGGSIDVGGDVTALGLQTADADQMMAFL